MKKKIPMTMRIKPVYDLRGYALCYAVAHELWGQPILSKSKRSFRFVDKDGTTMAVIPVKGQPLTIPPFNPVENDAQAFALAKKHIAQLRRFRSATRPQEWIAATAHSTCRSKDANTAILRAIASRRYLTKKIPEVLL